LAENPEGAISVMLEKPSVIKRPVMVDAGTVLAVGFAADTYQSLF
jgi:arsenate reductase